MTAEISSVLLSQLSKSVAQQMGLRFPRERWADLERGIRSAAREFNFKDVESCIHWLISSTQTKKTIELLASYLTIGETYFFRENKTFKVLEEQILPELIRSRRRNERCLRIWSVRIVYNESDTLSSFGQSGPLQSWGNILTVTGMTRGNLSVM